MRIKAFQKILHDDPVMKEMFSLAADWKTLELAAQEVAQRELHRLFPEHQQDTLVHAGKTRSVVVDTPRTQTHSIATTAFSDFTDLEVEQLIN